MIGCQSLLSVSMVTPVNRIVDERVLHGHIFFYLFFFFGFIIYVHHDII